MPDIYTMDSFEEQKNSKFQMHYGEAQTAELELVRVADVGSSERQKQFSLVFLGPTDAPVAQGIYKVDHEALGAFDLFLVPIGKDHTGVSYEAIFNRVVES